MVYVKYVILIFGIIVATELLVSGLFRLSPGFEIWFRKNEKRNMIILKAIQIILSVYLGRRLLGL